ncbi:PucR family transcriptional regulator ligand-binding domain-containing protein [Domibacillus indicus]|uniref:PucR family transcriptional regulator n=1 Tax=Domibacillus indicus TaxID=1437523 RepID=UPI00203C7715|nr:PucR family transcriptional regulator [Domibacillus indicus]MCM3789376.1 PucR family transcriptional regulator ligand-binding domain-containing protein [Domibacillus indicus]
MFMKDLLNLPVFSGAVVAGGREGLDREVNTVNMMDAPDIVSYLKPNELLVTTAFHLKDNPSSLSELLEEMHKQGCAGLGIKTKRFLHHIPEEAVELADRYEMPLVDIPFETSLGDIVHQSLSCILDMRTTELHQAMKTHQQFTNFILNGQGLDKILQSLSGLIGDQVTLLNHQLRPFYSTGDLGDPFYSLFAGMGAHLPKAGLTAFSLRDSEIQKTFTLFPIYTHKKQPSYLAVHRFIPPTDRSAVLTVEQAANVIAFELMKENALKQKTQRLRNEFFTNFMNGAFSSSEEILNRAKEFGLSNENRYFCAAGRIDQSEKSFSLAEHQWESELIYDTIDEDIQGTGENMQLFASEDKFVILMEARGNWKNSEESFVSFLKAVQSSVGTLLQKTISFGISTYAEQLLRLPEAYKESVNALYYGAMLGSTGFIESYQPKEVSEILRMIPYEQMKQFYHNTFQALVDEPKKDYDLLMQTLSVYLESHCQLSETAKRLFIHRNTVIYRLEKCEELLGRSLKDPEQTLCLRLAFRIKALLQNS